MTEKNIIEYWHNCKRYAIGLTGDQKLRWGTIEIYTENGEKKSRVVHEYGHYKTAAEAQSMLDSLAKYAKWDIFQIR